MFGGANAPNGWFICDGSVKSRTDYAYLFSVIGTSFNSGGESGSEFRLPDLKGKVAVGYDSIQTEFDHLGGTPSVYKGEKHIH